MYYELVQVTYDIIMCNKFSQDDTIHHLVGAFVYTRESIHESIREHSEQCESIPKNKRLFLNASLQSLACHTFVPGNLTRRNNIDVQYYT